MKIKLILIFFLLLSICSLLPAPYVFADIPHLINYQGRLTDSGGVPLNGAYAITFRIYDAETAGNLLWEEVQSGVVINKGIFSVLLGSVTNLNIPFDKPYFLEIKVGNEVMTPRQRIASAAYAIRAEKSEKAVKAEGLSISGQQGDILYYNGSNWINLGAGTSGQYLQTQGTGGMPVWADPSSFTHMNIATASRALGAVYRNTTGKPMWVSVMSYQTSTHSLIAYCDNNSNPTTKVSYQSTTSDGGGRRTNVHFVVLPNYYYKVYSTQSASIESWIEWY